MLTFAHFRLRHSLPGGENMHTLSIRIPDATLKSLDAIAKENRKTVEGLVETLLEDFADTDEARLAEYEHTGQGISHEVAMAWLRDLADGNYRPCPK
jgi:predicted transcriptional regulator